jgi:hypothetical protein
MSLTNISPTADGQWVAKLAGHLGCAPYAGTASARYAGQVRQSEAARRMPRYAPI